MNTKKSFTTATGDFNSRPAIRKIGSKTGGSVRLMLSKLSIKKDNNLKTERF